jgi:hypothetical protein
MFSRRFVNSAQRLLSNCRASGEYLSLTNIPSHTGACLPSKGLNRHTENVHERAIFVRLDRRLSKSYYSAQHTHPSAHASLIPGVQGYKTGCGSGMYH